PLAHILGAHLPIAEPRQGPPQAGLILRPADDGRQLPLRAPLRKLDGKALSHGDQPRPGPPRSALPLNEEGAGMLACPFAARCGVRKGDLALPTALGPTPKTPGNQRTRPTHPPLDTRQSSSATPCRKPLP